jgi:hypothetical protein
MTLHVGMVAVEERGKIARLARPRSVWAVARVSITAMPTKETVPPPRCWQGFPLGGHRRRHGALLIGASHAPHEALSLQCSTHRVCPSITLDYTES